MQVKPKNKKERNAAKALARSKRNSPSPQREDAKLRLARTRKLSRQQHRTLQRALQAGQTVIIDEIVDIPEEKLVDITDMVMKVSRLKAEKMTVKELRETATKLGIKTTTKMKKSEIIDLIIGAS